VTASPLERRRAIGYRLLGSRFDYLLHLRPAEWPIVAAHTAVGAVLALGRADPGSTEWWPSVVGIGLWVVCLNGGTLAVNSAFDRDTGDIAYLRTPPPPPRHLFRFGLAAMLAGLALSWALPVAYRLTYGLCVALSLLYSVPPARFKGVAGLDWLINMVGFGTLTPLAGWLGTGLPVDPVGRAVLLAFCPLFAGLYPLTQLYQLEEDRARGDRTLATVLGVRRSLQVSLVAAGAALVIVGWAVAVEARNGSPVGSGALVALGGAAAAWAVLLVPWLARGAALSPASHQRRMYYALGAWAATDAAVVFAFARSGL
jgi:4-hydroxybenzoate polyprenyltransferase